MGRSGFAGSVRRWWVSAPLLACAVLGASPAAACTATPSVATDLGSFSPAAIRAGAVPAQRSRAGLVCPTSILALLSNNFIRARYQSANNLRLNPVSGTAAAIPYVLSADAGGTVVAAQNGTIDYMQNNLLNLLGLLGGSSADLPFFVRPSASTPPAVGTYTDRITIRWTWYICPGVVALGICLLGATEGTADTIVDITLTVTPRTMTVTTASQTTWDPISGTSSPKAIPGSRQRVSVTLTNPDLVPTDDGVTVVVPIATRQSFAPDGDGTTGGSNGIRATTGTGTTLTYTDPASTTDDVDFSADGGATWSFVPGSGGPPQVRADTIRFRPRGPLAAGATFVLSFPVQTQ